MWKSCLLRQVRCLSMTYPLFLHLMGNTAKHFDRDPDTNEVFWFSAPPLNVAHSPAPKYSLAYLHFLATKRKKEMEAADGKDVDIDAALKRQRLQGTPTVTETLNKLLAEMP